MAEVSGVQLRQPKSGYRRGSMARMIGTVHGSANGNGSGSGSDNCSGNPQRRGSAMRLSLVGSDNNQRRGSASFHMFKDLEAKQECQKLRLASFLRELHKLAHEETTQKVRDSLSSAPRSSTASTASTTTTASSDGTLSFDVSLLDLTTDLTPALAKTKMEALFAGEQFDSDSLIRLVQSAVIVMAEEETVVDVRDMHPNKDLVKVTVVGDLHGSLNCLQSVLEFVEIDTLLMPVDDGGDDGGWRVVIFDGDFVDRGNNSLEVLAVLLLLKLSHPKNIVLLRGNHEDSMTASTYGFRDEIEDKYGYEKGDEIWYEFGHLFAAFPIIARTNTAVVMHGGIPNEGLSLEDVNAISKETRCELKTISDPYDDDEQLVQGILWSDPSEEEGINLSDRGAGYCFGPDITKDFLERHELKYIICAHEPFEDGFYHHHKGIGGGDRGVVTVFSTANYPCGEGENMGAVLHLDDEIGVYEIKSFIHKEPSSSGDGANTKIQTMFLRSFIDDHKSKLTKAFRAIQNANGRVTCEQWADIVGDLLDLPDVPWMDLQPDLAPSTSESDIDWADFLKRMSTKTPQMELLEKEQVSFLHTHKDKFLGIFNLLDVDGNGSISKKEFASGMQMLNEQIPGNKKEVTQDVEKLFHIFDTDGNGEISIEEFCNALKESATLQGLTDCLDLNQVEALQENHEILQMAFKYLDKDHSGAIDREEFQKGIQVLNKRLPERNKLGDPKLLFDLLDLDGNGEIGTSALLLARLKQALLYSCELISSTIYTVLHIFSLYIDLNEFNQLFRVI